MLLGRPGQFGRRVAHPVFSQLDIAPTVLDLLDLEVKNHFLGRSMVDPRNRGEVTQFLIQPFDGTYVSIVKFPYKYIYHRLGGEELLLDLLRDPWEKSNLIDLPSSRGVLQDFRNELDKFHLYERTVEENRIWPYDDGGD